MFQYRMTFFGQTVLALIAGVHFAAACAVKRRDKWTPTRSELAGFCGASVFCVTAFAL
ncbi:hypothetical protein RDE2_53170 (plasmid) [Rhodococcus sp. RDE2]|nr:hypothetical protein RDE2_53170 [Rhodococcus sp. RDE2]